MKREKMVALQLSRIPTPIMIALTGHGQGDEPTKKCYVAVKSFFDIVSVQVESALRKQRCAGGFCSSNSEMTKELTNCQRPMEHR